jgi:drug/metabolite transporter (DMT)-like permease
LDWPIFVFFYLVLGTTHQLLRRVLGQRLAQYNAVINLFFFLFVHYPLGLLLAFTIGFDLNIGLANIIIIVLMSCFFPIYNLLEFKASEHIEAGFFAIISNVKPVVAIVFGYLILSERMSFKEIAGATLIIIAAFLYSSFTYKGASQHSKSGLMIAFSAILISGSLGVYEVWILQRVGFGEYLVLGWGMQTFWMVIISWPQIHNLKKLFNKENGFPVLALSLANSLKGFSFLTALYLSNNVSKVSAYVSFLPIFVVIAGYFILREKNNIKLRIFCSALGCLGLLQLALG